MTKRAIPEFVYEFIRYAETVPAAVIDNYELVELVVNRNWEKRLNTLSKEEIVHVRTTEHSGEEGYTLENLLTLEYHESYWSITPQNSLDGYKNHIKLFDLVPKRLPDSLLASYKKLQTERLLGAHRPSQESNTT